MLPCAVAVTPYHLQWHPSRDRCAERPIIQIVWDVETRHSIDTLSHKVVMPAICCFG